ncbi:MAG: acetyl-CoA carboxylase carboxyl transferase subunit alpha, partial [Verrucomicrobiota bacterium]
ISPEGCAAILWKDRSHASRAAEALKITADKLLELGIVDAIIPEPLGGAHMDAQAAGEQLGKALEEHLGAIRKLTDKKMLDGRYEKFRQMGVFSEA